MGTRVSSGGAVLRAPGWMDQALNWKYGFHTQMRDFVTDEGMWFENSWAYHFYTLMSMSEIAEAGHALLRRPKTNSTALLTFDAYIGFHSHFDMLNFIYYGPGYEYIKNAWSAPTTGQVRLRFSGEKLDNCMTLAGGQRTQITTGHGPFGSVLIRSPLVFARRRGQRAIFAAVFEPVKKGKRTKVKSVKCRRRGKELLVAISRLGGQD